jgi:hypothetical protein
MSESKEDFCTRCGAEIEELATIFGEICDTCRHELAKQWLKLLDEKFGNAMASEIIENLNAPGMSSMEGVDFANTGSGLYREGERLHFSPGEPPEEEDTRPGKIKNSLASPTAKHLADWTVTGLESSKIGIRYVHILRNGHGKYKWLVLVGEAGLEMCENWGHKKICGYSDDLADAKRDGMAALVKANAEDE